MRNLKYKHVVLLVSGYSGVGKDFFIDEIEWNHGDAISKVSFVGQARRFVQEVLGFSNESVFGPSENRNKLYFSKKKADFYRHGIVQKEIGDEILFFRPDGSQVTGSELQKYFLSSREALIEICNKVNELDPFAWVANAFDTHSKLSWNKYSNYDPITGKIRRIDKRREFSMSASSGVRRIYDFQYIEKRKNELGQGIKCYLIRITSNRVPNPPSDNPGETDQLLVGNEVYDYIIENNGTKEEFKESIRNFYENVILKDVFDPV